MERDLNRSVRLLEDALSPHGRSLLRTATPKRQKPVPKTIDLDDIQDVSVIQGDISKDDSQVLFTRDDSRSFLDQTTVGVPLSTRPWEHAISSLYTEYLEIIQAHNNMPQVFETVSDLARCCDDTLNVVRGLKSKVKGKIDDEEKWLENERNTWRLIYCLYQDRLGFNKEENQAQYFGVSEKLCIENLYRKNALMRESQLIIDWLECNCFDRESVMPRVEYFTDHNVGWENTLHQLAASDKIVFKSSCPIINKIDPDAPVRQNRPLHDLDEEDDIRLCKKIFMDIRCGKFEDAQKLCMHCGHAWRAALLEGWRLHHDPNANHNENVDKSIRHPIEGNENRDLWKKIAWEYCHKTDLHIYERATVAAFCGCLHILLIVCKSWEDILWAYMKTMVDIRVESEIRDYVSKNYLPLPPDYWKNKMSLDDVFVKISAYPMAKIKKEAEEPDHIIQKYIILDQIPQLMIEIDKWLHEANCSPQFIRFLAHLVLFLRQIGQIHRDDIAEKVLVAYVKILIENINEPQLISYYTATLGKESQIEMYSLYLENISDNNERKEALQNAEDTGLDVQAITKYVTEKIISKSDEDVRQLGNLNKTLTDSDKTKISALDWVLFYPSQSAEAIYQSNILVSYFLILGKMEAAKIAFSKIPLHFIDNILSNSDEVPEYIHRWIREHLCYKSYLDAHEAFNDWFKYFNSKPVSPPPLTENVGFSEKVAHEHKMNQYQAECDRWKITVSHLAKTAKTMLYNVLLFPDGGWLTGAENGEHLRSRCIPEAVMLLYTVMYETGELSECLQLSDIITSEKYCLYTVFSKDKLEDFLQRICETSVKLVEEKNDMWIV